eukprot:gene17293-19023_t
MKKIARSKSCPQKPNLATIFEAKPLRKTSDSLLSNGERSSSDFDTISISSKSFSEQTADLFISTVDFKAFGPNEISLERGQVVEVLSKPPGSKSWRVRPKGDVLQEGLVPFTVLRKFDEGGRPLKFGKRSSVETLNSHSSEDSINQSSDTSSGKVSPSSRRRSKSVNLGTLKMKTWSRNAGRRFTSATSKSPLPTLPSRTTTLSGGGSKKLQQLLGAPRNDIDLLLRPTGDVRSATLGRVPKGKKNQAFKKRISLDIEDAGFQEGDCISEGESGSDSNESIVPGSVSAEVQASALKKRNFVWKELLQTEHEYVKDLEAIIKNYIPALSNSKTPEELKGKERLIFGNIEDIYEFHKNVVKKELEKLDNAPDRLANDFLKMEKKWQMYVTYCQYKPKSMTLLHDYLDTYFEEMRKKFGHRSKLSDYLIKPVQRLMRYQVFFKEFVKYTNRAGLDSTELRKCLLMMKVIPKNANDMMNIGMLEGFSGNLSAQGKLILQDSLYVANAKTRSKPEERRVFLFEQLLVFSEPFERKSDFTVFIYRHGIKMNTLGLTENFDEDANQFAVWTKNANGGSEIFVLVAKSQNIKRCWVDAIRSILETQLCFSKALQHQTGYQRGPQSKEHLDGPCSPVKSIPGRMLLQDDDKLSLKSSSSDFLQIDQKSNMGKISPSGQVLKPTSSLKHVKLISLAAAKSLEDLTKAFPVQERYIVLESYQAQSPEEMTVYKNDVVFFVSKHRKNAQMVNVRNFCRERSGYVPTSILKRTSESDDVKKGKVGEILNFIDGIRRSISVFICVLVRAEGRSEVLQRASKTPPRLRVLATFTMPVKMIKSILIAFGLVNDLRLRRAASFGHEKPKRERAKRTKSLSTTKRKREVAIARRKDKGTSTENSNGGGGESAERIHGQWTTNLAESSDDEITYSDSASDSLARILSNRETKTTFEVAPEFKILPRDVTVDSPNSVKITCTLIANPEAEIIWTKNDTVELYTGDKYVVTNKGHLCMLEILDSHPSDSGTYTVSATNALGSASCCVKVTVKEYVVGLCVMSLEGVYSFGGKCLEVRLIFEAATASLCFQKYAMNC